MRKASKILFLIGGILTILAAIAFVAIGGVSLTAGALAKSAGCPEWVIKMINEIMADSKCTFEQAVDSLLTVGVLFVVEFVLCIPCAVLAFICNGKDRRPLPLLIVATAFAVLAWSPLCLAGGVLGIVNWATVERKEREAQQ